MIVPPASKVWKTGLELELLAAPGHSRADLACAIADDHGGTVHRVFTQQSEFARIDGTPVLESLTLGFAVQDSDGTPLVSCVDDLTLVDDLDASAEPRSGWYRILSDDLRFLNLVALHCDPTTARADVLAPLAALFKTDLDVLEEGAVARVCDQQGATIAMAVPLPGERERPCELVTAPLSANRDALLKGYLKQAERLGFTVPVEAATHLHFDCTPLRDASVIAALIHVFGTYRLDLRKLVDTNPRCRRLGDWPKALYQTVRQPGFASLPWEKAVEQLRETEPKKYCDFNLLNLLMDTRDKPTFEVRILPGSIDVDFILQSMRLFEELLRLCASGDVSLEDALPPLPTLLNRLPLSAEDQTFWQGRAQRPGTRWRFGFRS
jgi:Putative amidoligase enzyme